MGSIGLTPAPGLGNRVGMAVPSRLPCTLSIPGRWAGRSVTRENGGSDGGCYTLLWIILSVATYYYMAHNYVLLCILIIAHYYLLLSITYPLLHIKCLTQIFYIHLFVSHYYTIITRYYI